MNRIATLILVIGLPAAADAQTTLCSDGSWVGGDPRLAPDGTWAGGEPELAPDGDWVGDGHP